MLLVTLHCIRHLDLADVIPHEVKVFFHVLILTRCQLLRPVSYVLQSQWQATYGTIHCSFSRYGDVRAKIEAARGASCGSI